MSQKIYIITAGCYSDYHICAATTDKEKAERLKVLFKDSYNGSEIEEYEDGMFDRVLFDQYKPYRVFFKQNGSVYAVSESEIEYFKEEVYIPRYGDGIVGCFARDETHARKIAIDRYAKAKAERLGL